MYQVYVNGELFGTSENPGSEYLLSSPSVSVELNKSGSFECVIYPPHKFYNRLIKMKSYVEVFLAERRIFSGRLLRTEVNSSREMSCYFEGELSYLLDSIQPPEEHEETVSDYFKRVIETHNSQVDVEKRFEVGIIDIDSADKKETFNETRYADTYSVLQSEFLNQYGGYFWIRDFGGNRYLDYVKDYDQLSTQELNFGENAIDLTESISGEDIYTVLLPLGPSQNTTDKDNKTTTKIMTIESVNGGSIYLEDRELVDRYGWIVKTHSFDDAENPSDLLEKAKKFQEEDCLGLSTSFEIKAVDLSIFGKDIRQICLGDKVPVVSKPHKIKTRLPCSAIEYNLSQPWETTYTIGIVTQELSQKYTSSVASINNAVQSHGYSMGQMGSQINKAEQDIVINANSITANADRIEANARSIAFNAEQIALRATKEEFDEAHNRMIELEAEIQIHAGEIALRAKTEYVDMLDQKHTGEEERMYSRIEKAEIDISNGQINMDTLSANLYGDISRIDKTYEELAAYVDEIGEGVADANIRIDSNTANIALKADSTVVDEVGKRVTAAEVSIDGLKGQIELKVDKNGVIAAIRVSPETVTIQASKINLSGYVTASQLNATNANFDNLIAGNTTATYIKARTLSSTYLVTDNISMANHSWTSKSIDVNGTTIHYLGW